MPPQPITQLILYRRRHYGEHLTLHGVLNRELPPLRRQHLYRLINPQAIPQLKHNSIKPSKHSQ